MIMWYICGLLILGIGTSADDNDFCEENKNTFPKASCYSATCMTAIENHIEEEFHAAFAYLYMGALFGQFIVERPGMANFFLESATEERGHAIQMMDYLNMRGIAYTKNYTFSNELLWQPNGNQMIKSELTELKIASALEKALEMENKVTKMINEVVKECADDYHAADVFTNPILEEQHTGMRKLQGAITTLAELSRNQAGEGLSFAEYVFDQKMLKGEL